MRTRHPFEDVPLEMDLVGSMGDGMTEGQAQELIPGAVKPLHPDYAEKGIELSLGFRQHQGENRKTRRAAVANWQPPKNTQDRGPEVTSLPGPAMPTRRELLKQRQRRRRGKLDVETRRLQRKATK